jgi:hypothetical protein
VSVALQQSAMGGVAIASIRYVLGKHMLRELPRVIQHKDVIRPNPQDNEQDQTVQFGIERNSKELLVDQDRDGKRHDDHEDAAQCHQCRSRMNPHPKDHKEHRKNSKIHISFVNIRMNSFCKLKKLNQYILNVATSAVDM